MPRTRRTKDYRRPENRLTPVQAIRKKCLECCGGSRKFVRECEIHDCPLWPYRLGKRPAADGDFQFDQCNPEQVHSDGATEDTGGELRDAPSAQQLPC